MDVFATLPESVRRLLVVEMSMGQMIDDVRIANEGRLPISFVGRTGGMVPTRSSSPTRCGTCWPEVRDDRCLRPDDRAAAARDAPRPGCTHGLIHRLVGEVLDELGVRAGHRCRAGRLLGARL